MNFEQWRDLTSQQQKTTAATWNIEKDEGQEIAEAVLRVFIEKFGQNKSFQINEKIVRGNLEWIILVRYFDDTFLPKNFIGITVAGYHIDHAADEVSLAEVLTEFFRRHLITRPFKAPHISKWTEALRN